MREMPDPTLHALLAALAARGVLVSCDTLWRFLVREGISFKETVLASEEDRPDVVRRRARWKNMQEWLDPARLVFIDETRAKTIMSRTHGWWQRGKALLAKVPHGHWKTMTFLAALRRDGITAPFVLDGLSNGESFATYVEHVLVPTLKPGDIVALDTLGSHKASAIRHMIRAAGARLVFLPPYSLDLNPIAQVFSKLKRLLRKAEPRSPDRVRHSIGQFLGHFTSQECAGYL